jgi:photosystem II stability/assembly factor-like uncharacterized protein
LGAAGAPGVAGTPGGAGRGGAGLAGAPGGAGATGTGPYVWKNVAVGGGGFVTGVVFHPAQAGLLYARTDIGGAYRWNAASASWTSITDAVVREQADTLGVLALAVDPGDANKVYLMTGKYTQSWAGTGWVLASRDQGTSWTRSTLSVKVGGNENGRGAGERLAVDPNLGSVLFMGTTVDGLWRSANGASSFTRITAFSPAHVTFVQFDKASGTAGAATPRIFAGTATTSGSLMRSTDGGTSWAAVAGQPTGVMALRAAQAGADLYITYANAVGPNDATNGAVWRYNTGTGAWTDVSPPKGSYGFGGVSVDAQSPDRLLVSTLDRWAPNDEAYLSTNGGTSWTPLLAGATFTRVKAPYTSSLTPHWLADIKIDPFNPSRAVFVTGYGLWMTTSLTSTASATSTSWAFEDAGLEETVAMQLVSPPTGAPLLSAMGDIDGFKHDDLDVSPAAGRFSPNVGTTLAIAFAEAAPTKLVKAFNAAPYGGTSTNGGASWTAFASAPAGTTGGGTRSIAVSADGTKIVWAPVGGALSHSTNNGGSWTASSGGVPAGVSPVADRVDPNRFFVADGVAGRVYVSADGGKSFAMTASGLPTVPDYSRADAELATVPGQANHAWLTTGAGGLHQSTNGGTSFAKVAGVTAAYKVGFGKAAAGQTYPAIYIWGTVGGAFGIFRSDNQGQSWTRINDDQHQFGWIHSLIGDPRVFGRVYVGTEGRGVQYGQPR